jgi:hypothetical protein
MRRLAALLALPLLLAGCSDDPAGADDPAAGDGESPGDGAMLAASGVIPAPAWQVGQWWEWQTSFGSATAEGTHKSIVLSDQGSSYTLVTDQDSMAKEDAAFDHPLVGGIGKGDLAFETDGLSFSVLSFPLTDGKTWATTLPNIAWDIFLPSTTVEVAMTAALLDPVDGAAPRVALTGMSGEHKLLDAVYDPASGWFAQLNLYDVDPGQEGLEIGYAAVASGLGYTGPYFQHSAAPLLQFVDLVGFSDVPTEGGQPYTSPPQPHHTFTMGEGTTLFGYLGGASVAGGRVFVLVDPQNGQRNHAVTGAPEGEGFVFIDEQGKPGEWRLGTVGAGGFSGAFVELFEVTLGGGEMGGAGPAPAA